MGSGLWGEGLCPITIASARWATAFLLGTFILGTLSPLGTLFWGCDGAVFPKGHWEGIREIPLLRRSGVGGFGISVAAILIH